MRSQRRADLMSSLEDKIRARAYEIAELASFTGDPEDYWKQAEREIQARAGLELTPCQAKASIKEVTPALPVFPAVEAPRPQDSIYRATSHARQGLGPRALRRLNSFLGAAAQLRIPHLGTVRGI